MVQLAPESSAPKEGILPVRIVKEIWREITFGVGTWGRYDHWSPPCWPPCLSSSWDSISIASIDEVSNGVFSRFRWP